MKPFIYLIQSTSATPYPEISHPACDRLVFNRHDSAVDDALAGGTVFVPQASWSEGRNLLLWAAQRQARTTDNDYLYYIFVDDGCILREDLELAKCLDASLTGNPFRTFENFLLEWLPAVGSVRHGRQHYDGGRTVTLGHDPNYLFSAFHRDTLSFLLPYYTGFDSESWLYSQHIVNQMADLLYHFHRIRSNLVITDCIDRPDYGPRKKYWDIPTTFLATALKPELRRVLNSRTVDNGLPALERPRKKKGFYCLSSADIARQWHIDHPLVKHRRLQAIEPRPVRTLPRQNSARVAVCLSGSCRGLDRSHDNIREKLLDPLARYGEYDLFMYVPDDADAGNATLLKPTVLRVVADHHLDEDGLVNGRDCLLKVGIQRYLQQLYGLKMCDELRQAHEKADNISYDAVLRCRPDLLFERPLADLTTLDLNYIHVPDFHMFEGCNDRFAIGNPEHMGIYMNKYDDWAAYVKNWINAGPGAPPVTAEMYTCGQLRQYGIGIRLMPFRFDRVRPDRIETDRQNHQRKERRHWRKS